MTKTITLLIISLLRSVVFGQANLSLFKRSDECANRDYTASTEDKANHAIMDSLLPKSEYPHLLNSIQVRACPGLNNCITRLLKPGSKTVLILYDTAFIEKRKKSAAQADNSGLTYKGETRDWVTMGIFAHELGHILCRHVDDSVQTDPHQSELQADEYIGILLRKMGATLQQAQSCMIGSKISDEGDHPGRDKRFRAIERGYYGLYLQKAIQVFHAGDSALAYKILINKDLELNAEGYLCLAELQEKGRGGAVRDTFDAIENYEKAIRADSNCNAICPNAFQDSTDGNLCLSWRRASTVKNEVVPLFMKVIAVEAQPPVGMGRNYALADPNQTEAYQNTWRKCTISAIYMSKSFYEKLCECITSRPKISGILKSIDNP